MAILVYKQISSYSFKNESTDKLIWHIMYSYLNLCKQMIDVKQLLLHRNTWNQLTVKKWAQSCLKILSKNVLTNHI